MPVSFGGNIGINFQPGATNGGEQGSPVQRAIKLLSLRLPEQASPSAIAPMALLQGQGGAGVGGDAGLMLVAATVGDERGADPA